MKKVLILFGKFNWRKSKPFSNKKYMYSYEYFYSLCKEEGIQMYRASYEWYDFEKNIFKYAWIYEGKNANWKRVYNIRPDIIYDKTKASQEVYYIKEKIGKKYPFFNNLNFTQLIDDKLVVGLLFNKWSKKNWLVSNRYELQAAAKEIKDKKIVLKPLIESGGKKIQIFNRRNIPKKFPEKMPFLAQEFIDSSRGVPGVSTAVHDLRLVLVNDKIIYSYIREPKPGSYLANLAQGGTLKIVPISKLPSSVFPIVDYANKLFETFYPRVYTIDLMFDQEKKPWIVELNSMPGLFFTSEEKPYMTEMYKELLKVFKKLLKK